MIRFILNETAIQTGLPAGMVLLDFIRYRQHLKGTKIGCREGDCGACTVLIGELIKDQVKYRSMTSCLVPLANVEGKHVVTIEGINGADLNPIQLAMSEEGATQCGFCTPGFVMSLAGHCLDEKISSEQKAIACMDGNICRCTGYKSIERAALRINELLSGKKDGDSIPFVIGKKILPDYFSSIVTKLLELKKSTSDNSLSQFPDTKVNLSSITTVNHIAGGTDLYVQKHEELVHASSQYLFDRSAMNGIIKDGQRCVMGASVTVSDLLESPVMKAYFPSFSKYARLVSSTPIRNMATLAGNFVNASPIGDFTIFFLALDATLILSAGEETREVPLRNFYKGYKSLDKRPEEIVQKIWFELPGANSKFNFEKVSKRTHLDIASVNSALLLEMEGNNVIKAILSAGGVGPVPMVLTKTSQFLAGKALSVEIIPETIKIALSEIAPISDARGSKEYKSLLLAQLIKSHFLELFPEIISEDLVMIS